jgi:hypothetical protein
MRGGGRPIKNFSETSEGSQPAMSTQPIDLRDDLSLDENSSDPALEDHPLVLAVRDGAEGVDLLRAVQQQMARAAAKLAWLDLHRSEFESEALLERGRAISRGVRATKRLAEMERLRTRRFGTQPTVLEGHPQVRLVLSLLLDRIAEVAHEVLSEHKADELDAKFRVVLEADPGVPWP